jgi:hypothetical protein
MKKLFVFCGAVTALVVMISFQSRFTEYIPATWDIEAIKQFHLPPPDSSVKVEYASEQYYNSLPEHVITKTFPMYILQKENARYIDSLRQLEPEVVFDGKKIISEEDWIKAGELVFNWPVAYTPFNGNVSGIDSSLFKNGNGKLTKDGVYLFSSYVIDQKGKLLVGSLSCASCHTRVTESGEAIAGAQGNVFNNVRFAKAVETERIPFPVFQDGVYRLNYSPWAPKEFPNKPTTPKEFADFIRTQKPGVIDRQGVAYQYPLSVPSLIGLKDIKYLDHTGLMKHDSPADLMRYAAFNQGLDMLTSYNGFLPLAKNNHREMPTPKEWNHPFGYAGKRYSDEQLYALTKYIYSLQPPRNPNTPSPKTVEKGRMIFNRSGCVTCHTPPLYTNNKLTPANGFEPPHEHFKKYNIFNVSVETDSVSTLYSRRGTGYYKVPSLRGVWFRSAFFHNGNLSTLEEVLDPGRVRSDFVPTGYKPPHVRTMAVKGHPFGFELTAEEKQALIVFLKTL